MSFKHLAPLWHDLMKKDNFARRQIYPYDLSEVIVGQKFYLDEKDGLKPYVGIISIYKADFNTLAKIHLPNGSSKSVAIERLTHDPTSFYHLELVHMRIKDPELKKSA